MKRRSHHNIAIELPLAFVMAIWAIGACVAVAEEPCKLTSIGTAKIAAVRDGRTLLLEDGRELRLAAIEVDDAARDALRSLIGG
jgi:hypothetical protein